MSGQTSTTTLSRKARARWEVPLARSLVYGFLSLSYLYPKESYLDELKGALDKVDASLAFLGAQPCQEALRPLGRRLEALSSAELVEEHVSAFGHIISRECPPYEMEYGQGEIFLKSQEMADISGFYTAFGLQVSPDIKERPDHIAVELEFMQFLSAKEAYARTQGHGRAKVHLCQKAQRRFLEEHLGCWAPLFTQLLEGKAGSGTYGHLARLTRSFLTQEVAAVGAKPAEFKGQLPQEPSVATSPLGCPHETLEDCGGCEP